MQPMFTTNESEIPRLEGLYIKERNPPALISGVFLGVVGMVGEAVRGPVDKPVEITSPARFSDVFGGKSRSGAGAITSTLWKALLNKRFGKIVMVRAAAAAATAGTRSISDATTPIVRIDANGPGAYSGDVFTQVKDATDGDANHWNLQITYQNKSFLLRNLDTTTGNDNLTATFGADDANPVVITKLADGRPLNDATAVALSAGSDGTVADTDFTATARGISLLATYPGIGTVMVAERMSTAIRARILVLASTATDRLFIVTHDNETINPASTKAVADLVRNADGRIIFAYNHPYTIDPDTNVEVLTSPSSWYASVLSQSDIDIDPGDVDNKVLLAGITRLQMESLTREDYITLREAGVSAFEKDEGFGIVSAVTTSLVPGKERVVRRRCADFLQISMANGLKSSVKKKNTLSRRAANGGMLAGFLEELRAGERVVADYVVDLESLNSDAARAQGIERIYTKVKLIPHMLEIVLETEIGTTVVVQAK